MEQELEIYKTQAYERAVTWKMAEARLQDVCIQKKQRDEENCDLKSRLQGIQVNAYGNGGVLSLQYLGILSCPPIQF